MCCPNTPFATRLSGSAKETQVRIRNIFQWKKLRPPVWLFTLIVLVILGCIGLVSCKPEQEVLCLGLNARVVEIDTEQMILYIQDIDENANLFGQRCALDCKQAAQEERLIFVDYETHELTNISFYEFRVGDKIVIEMYTSQKEGAKDNTARAEQVQLARYGTEKTLVGTWEMTSETAVVGVGQEPGQTVSSVIRISFQENGNGGWDTDFAGELPAVSRPFQYTVEGDQLVMEYDEGGSPDCFTFTQEGNTLTLNGRACLELTRCLGR